MSRVSNAMRRAGQEEAVPEVAPADEMTFVSGEEATEYLPPAYTAHRHEIEMPPSTAPMVVRERMVPLEAPRHEASDDVRILDVLRTLNRRRVLVAAVIAASLVAAATFNYLATPIYEARARLLIEPNSPEVVPFRGLTEDQGRPDYYVTQIEVLRSRALARRTLEHLNLLTKDPTRQADQVSQLLAGLTVAPSKSDMGESRVINLAYKSSNPAMTALVANGLAESYVDQNLQARRQGSRDAAEWLNQRLVELRSEVNTREGALQQYRVQKDSVSLGDQQNIVVQKLAQLSAMLTTARAERIDKRAVYQQLTEIQSSGAPLDTFAPILSNTFIQGLKAELAGLQRERGQLQGRLGELHPDMIRINTSIATAERRLRDEMAKVASSVQSEFKAAQAKEEALSAALEDQKRQVLELNQKSIGFGALQRDAASTRQMFETVQQRVKETELSGETQSNNAKILDAAEVPRRPIWPQNQLNLIIAFLGGSFIAVGLAFGLEYLNPRIAKPGDIAAALGLPLLGIAPKIHGMGNRSATLDSLPASFQEALRGIRTRIFLSPITATTRTLAVTSTTAGEGKTMVASNLAVSMAMAGRRVLLVDADMRRPQIHRIFNIKRSPGLSDVMAGEAKPSEVLLESPWPGLFILTAGTEVASPSDLLENERLTHLIQGFKQVFDIVVLDCPPVMAVSDATIIANAARSVLFVVGSGSTSRESARVAVDRLVSVDAQMVGVVLNKAKIERGSEYSYSGYLAEDAS